MTGDANAAGQGGRRPRRTRRTGALLGLALTLAAVGAAGLAWWWAAARPVSALSDRPAVVALGAQVYAARCAACHGANLEGQADWQSPRADRKMPAPPHDASGHTWHHDGGTLFGITKQGLVPPWAPPDYKSDMPAFAGALSDAEIWAVLSFIASRWTEEAKAWQREVEAQARR